MPVNKEPASWHAKCLPLTVQLPSLSVPTMRRVSGSSRCERDGADNQRMPRLPLSHQSSRSDWTIRRRWIPRLKSQLEWCEWCRGLALCHVICTVEIMAPQRHISAVLCTEPADGSTVFVGSFEFPQCWSASWFEASFWFRGGGGRIWSDVVMMQI